MASNTYRVNWSDMADRPPAAAPATSQLALNGTQQPLPAEPSNLDLLPKYVSPPPSPASARAPLAPPPINPPDLPATLRQPSKRSSRQSKCAWCIEGPASF